MMKIILFVVLSSFIAPLLAQTSNEVQGTRAGQSITSGDYNVIYGDDAGVNIDTESFNVIMGYRSCVGQLDDGAVGGNPDPGDGDLPPITLQDCDPTDSVIIGYHANLEGTGGDDNVIIGSKAGTQNRASDVTFLGARAGESNTTGFNNTFIGEDSGRNNTTGGNNVFVGEDAGFSNTTGSENTSIGRIAMQSNRAGRYNTAIGSEAGADIGGATLDFNATRNTAVGNKAGKDIGDGVGNTCVGDNACAHSESADFNTFVGLQAGFDNNRNNTNNDNNAQRNTGLGTYAGFSNREGTDNVWIGAFTDSGRRLPGYDHSGEISQMQSGSSWSPGSFGSSSGSDNTIFRTTVLGAFASAGENDSIAIGYNSRSDNTHSIALGTNTEATFTNSVAIGNNATTKAVNTVVIGNDTTVAQMPNIDAVTSLGDVSYRYANVISNKISINAPSATEARIDLSADSGSADDDVWSITASDGGDFTIGSFSTGADVSLLSISNNGDAVLSGDLTLNSDARLKQDIQSIVGALDSLKNIEGKTYQWKAENKGDGRQYGLIAQELERVIPELVKTKDDGMKTVNYQGLVPVLVSAVNELNANNRNQAEKIQKLEDLLERQEKAINQLIKQLD